jgi:hypothetical protein
MTRTGYVYALKLDIYPAAWVVGSTANTVAERVGAYFDPARSHGHIANLVRQLGPDRVTVAHVRPVRYSDSAELERQERATAQRWRARGLVVLCDQ